MQVQFNQSNYRPQFQALTKFNHAEIKSGLKVKKWAYSIIRAESKLRELARDVNIAVNAMPDEKRLDLRSVKYTISEIGGKQRQIKPTGFYPYIHDGKNITEYELTNNFLRRVKEEVEKFKTLTAMEEY